MSRSPKETGPDSSILLASFGACLTTRWNGPGMLRLKQEKAEFWVVETLVKERSPAAPWPSPPGQAARNR